MDNLWYGFSIDKMRFEDREAYVVSPMPGNANRKLMVKTEYWGAFPQAIEIPLLKQGYHLCYVQNDYRWGVDEDLDRKARFVRYVCRKYGLSSKTVPVGMSCGGLMAIKFAVKFPELVSCLYLDAPVLNYMSCPCGFGDGDALIDDDVNGISEILNALKMDSISQLICYRNMPMDNIPALLDKKIPVMMVAGGSDKVVPYHENGILLQRAYENACLEISVVIKPECNHHPHGLEDPNEAVAFILEHS